VVTLIPGEDLRDHFIKIDFLHVKI
jgi:hypothetical protein